MKKPLVLCASAFLFSIMAFSLSLSDEWNHYTPYNDVSSFVQEGDCLWWTGRYGIIQYNRFDGTYRAFSNEDYGEGHDWTAVAVAPNGAKWFGSMYGMIVRYDSSGWTLFKNLYQNDRTNYISTIVFDRSGKAWFGSKHGTVSFDGSVWKSYGVAEGFTDNEVLSALSDRSGNLWFGTDTEGLYRFDGETWTRFTASEDSLPSNTIRALACDENGAIWAATGKGLAVFENGVWNKLPPVGNPELPRESLVTALAPDREGGMWIGTAANLVYLHGDEKKIYTAENSTLNGEEVHALLLDTDGVLWVSQWFLFETPPQFGLSRFDGNVWSQAKIPIPVGNKTTSVLVDNDNMRWFATGGSHGGNPLVSFEGVAWRQYTEADGLVGNYVKSIAVDDTGRKWFCTNKGISCLNGSNWTNYTAENGLPGTEARKGAVDHNGIGWFSLDTGLYSFDGLTWTSWNDSVLTWDVDGNGQVNIGCIMVDRNNVKWFGNYGDGLLSFDDVVWKHYSKDDGLPGNNVRAIAVDHDNVVWAGSGVVGYDAGISSFDGIKWTVFKEGYNITGIAVDEANVKWVVANSLYSIDGTSWKSYSRPWSGLGGYNCIAIDRDGVKWLGSEKIGVVSFRESDGSVTGVSTANALPKGFAILGNSPNPFNPSTTISFSLPAAVKANLIVYDITGRKVRTLISGQLSAGNHASVWDGTDEMGRSVSSGVYIARLESGKSSHSAKMMLVR
jgi:ligand-binding sensor domain-containing protein